MNIGTLWAQIGLDSTPLEKGVDRVKGKLEEVHPQVEKVSNAFTTLAGSFAAGQLIANGVAAIGQQLMQIPKYIIDSIQVLDDFKTQVIQTAAIVTTLEMAAGRGGSGLAATYAQSKMYAEGVMEALIKMDPLTNLNLGGLQKINMELNKQGIFLDANNAKQFQGFLNLANAGAIASYNGTHEIMLQSEIASLARGEATARDMIATTIKSMVKGDFKEWVEQQKAAGTLIEAIGEKLQGFAPAAKDLEATWGAVTSSLKTTTMLIQRAGISEVYASAVSWVKDLNELLTANVAPMSIVIRTTWLTIRGIVSSIWDVFSMIIKGMDLVVSGSLSAFLSIMTNTNVQVKSMWDVFKFIMQGLAFAGSVLLPTFIEKIVDVVKVATGLVAVAVSFGEVMISAITAVASSIGTIGQAFWKGLTGDFAGAQQALSNLFSGAVKAGFSNSVVQFKSQMEMLGADWANLKSTKGLDSRLDAFFAAQQAPAKTVNNAAPPAPRPPEATQWEVNTEKWLKDLERARESYRAYENAFDARELALMQQQTAKELAELKNKHDQGLVAEQDYLDTRYIIQMQEYNREEELLQIAAVKATRAANDAQKAMLATKVGENSYDADAIVRRNNALKEAEQAWTKVNAVQAKNIQLEVAFQGATALAEKKRQIDMANLAIMQYESTLTRIDQQEKMYAISVTDAARERIAVLQKEVEQQQIIYDVIKGNEPQAQMLRQQVLDKITSINGKLLEQQILLRDRTAAGGAINALRDYADTAGNIGAQVKNMTTNAFKGMEDAIVKFARTGKLSFKELADSIISDMIRIATQQMMVGALTKLFGGVVGSFSSSSSSGVDMSGYGTIPSGMYGNTSPSYSLLGSYASGTEYVPKTGPYLLHEGEKVVTAEANKSTTVNVPVTIDGDPALSSALRNGIEETVIRILRERS